MEFTLRNGEIHPPILAQLRDVSLGGMKLVVPEAVETGTMLTVTLATEGETSITHLACVIHCDEIANNEWALGCSFSAELDERQLLAFGVEKSMGRGIEERNTARFPCKVTALCQLPNQTDVPAWRAEVFNVSMTGMAVTFDNCLPTGTLFSAELHGTDNRSPLTILACVVHVTTQPDGQRIHGCNFIRELSERDIQLLR
jgi:c-di-GMP-binding flagellar brake protein YcgR